MSYENEYVVRKLLQKRYDSTLSRKIHKIFTFKSREDWYINVGRYWRDAEVSLIYTPPSFYILKFNVNPF